MRVLILIFLENALRQKDKIEFLLKLKKVLILIFLENALRRRRRVFKNPLREVLILIFLENALRRSMEQRF